MTAYTDQTSIESYTGQTLQTPGQFVISAINQVSAYIERKTGRQFQADTTATARYFDSRSGDRLLFIDEAVEVTGVETVVDAVNGIYQALSTQDYDIEPFNETPKTCINLHSSMGNVEKAYKITARWGYSETVPDDIKLAATILAAGILLFNDSAKKSVTSERLGDFQVSYDTQTGLNQVDYAKSIVNSYKRPINLSF